MQMQGFKAIAFAAVLGVSAICVPVPVEAEVSTPVDQLVEINQENRDLIARVVMSEANGEPMVGKVAVVATIFNRARIYEMSISEVIYSPNQYSTANNGKPTQECYDAIDLYCECQELYPEDLIYFQLRSYSKYGEDYAQIGSHYFSTRKEKK